MLKFTLSSKKEPYMKKSYSFVVFFIIGLMSFQYVEAQLYINGGQLYIDSSAFITLKGDLISNTNINGTGKIILNGANSQSLSMNNFNIPNLEINNTQNIALASSAKIQQSLSFVNGKVIAGNNDLTISGNATLTGMGTGKFIETNGTGRVYKELSSNVASYEVPVGISTTYRPIFLTTSATAFNNAKVGIQSVASDFANRPSGTTDYLNTYWNITRTGITGSVNASGQYADPSDVNGSENNLRGCFYDNGQWSLVNSNNDANSNRVGAPVSNNGGVLYGMTRFAMIGIKAFLEGAYNSGAMRPTLFDLGLTNDATATDSITVNLWSSSGLSANSPSYSYKPIIHTDGSVNFIMPQSVIGNNYYFALKHRNSIETWSANTILINEITNYDFSSSLASAYNDGVNPAMKSLGVNTFGLYSGDTNQDGTVDGGDMNDVDNATIAGDFGYNNSDVNGDGASDGLDMNIVDNNTQAGLYFARP